MVDGNLDCLGFFTYLFLDSFLRGGVDRRRNVVGLGYVACEPIYTAEQKILNDPESMKCRIGSSASSNRVRAGF